MEFSQNVVVPNKYGIHARPATKIVELSNSFSAEILIIKDGSFVNGKSVIGIMTLGAEQGSSLTIKATGEEAENAVREIVELIDSGFGEEM